MPIGGKSGATGINIGQQACEAFIVTSPAIKTYTVVHKVIANSENVTLNGVVRVLGSSFDYTLSEKDIIFNVDQELQVGDIIQIRYSY